MTDSPTVAATGPVCCSLLINGAELSSGAEIEGISVSSALNQIPQAQIIIKDGDAINSQYPLSDSDTLKPGCEVVIKVGYGDATQVQIFKGVIVSHRLSIDADRGSRLSIECRDKSVAMTLERNNQTSVNTKDSDVIQSLIGNYAGLKSEVTASTIVHSELVQYYCTDWDYMLMRAEVNGMMVTVDDGTVTVGPPALEKSPVLDLKLGEDIIRFDADIDGTTQLQTVESSAWDIGRQEMASASAKTASLNQPGSWAGSDLAAAVGADTCRLQTPASVDQEALKEWAKARQLKAALARIQGSLSFQGSATARAGSVIELRGVGKQFEGKVFVSSVVHDIRAGDWVTEVKFGLSPEWYVENNTVAAPPATGWLPSISGLHVGVVKQLADDPQQQYRIQVHVSALGEHAKPVWARLSTDYASNGCGSFFIPEIGDEVVLGFINEDPSQAVILGSMYSSSRPPASPNTLENENHRKSLVTRSQLKLHFDDDTKTISIDTPAGNSIVLDEAGTSITIADQNNNSMTMNADGISLDSAKDISISAKGSVSISAASNVNVSAKSDVSVDGNNIDQSARMSYSAKGQASVELSASGNTTVKGAMVMIN